MNALVPIQEGIDGGQAVSGRALHAFLEVQSNYTTWFARMTEYGLMEGPDFLPVLEESTGGRRGVDHILTLDAAKEIAMIQRTDKGKQARAYFIEVEKRFRSGVQLGIPQSYAEALRAHADEVERRQELEAKAKADAPKVLFADSVAASKSTILVGDLAKILKANGIEVGANRLFERLREDGYLIRRRGADWNMPTQRSMELGLFEIKETAVTHSDGHITVNKTPKVTGKGQQYFINRYARQEVAA